MSNPLTAEHQRLADSNARRADWRNWGPYLSERAWGTVREDYSPDSDAWTYLPHDPGPQPGLSLEMRTGWPGSAIAIKTSVWLWLCGMSATPFSRNAFSG